jgi:hypothetical protein
MTLLAFFAGLFFGAIGAVGLLAMVAKKPAMPVPPHVARSLAEAGD